MVYTNHPRRPVNETAGNSALIFENRTLAVGSRLKVITQGERKRSPVHKVFLTAMSATILTTLALWMGTTAHSALTDRASNTRVDTAGCIMIRNAV